MLSGRARNAPKTEEVDALRALHVARRSAVKARTAAINQVHQLLITAPDDIRERYRALKDDKLIAALARTRPAANATVLIALKTIARRYEYLATEALTLHRQIATLVKAANPGLLAVHGVGPDTAAQLLITAGGNPERLTTEASFAALCGTAPVPASSGKITRHRLSRGGDRSANHALHTIALVRMSGPPAHQGLRRRHRDPARGKPRSSAEILRMLKRAIAREIFKHLTRPGAAPDVSDLTAAARAAASPSTKPRQPSAAAPPLSAASSAESAKNDPLIDRYRQWLTTS